MFQENSDEITKAVQKVGTEFFGVGILLLFYELPMACLCLLVVWTVPVLTRKKSSSC